MIMLYELGGLSNRKRFRVGVDAESQGAKIGSLRCPLTWGIVRCLLTDAGEPLAENSGCIGGPFEPETANTVEGSNLQGGPAD